MLTNVTLPTYLLFLLPLIHSPIQSAVTDSSYSLAEHAIGTVVGCMPLFPALYRHCHFCLSKSPSISTAPSTPPPVNNSGGWKRSFDPFGQKHHLGLGSESVLVRTQQSHGPIGAEGEREAELEMEMGEVKGQASDSREERYEEAEKGNDKGGQCHGVVELKLT